MSTPIVSEPLVLIRHSPFMCELRLNRGDKANALNAETVARLTTALSQLYADDTRLLVLSGDGKNFCAGFDQPKDVDEPRERVIERTVQIEVVLQLLWHAPFVTIARVQGAAMGAGADMLASCDYRLAEPGARFAFPGFRKFGVSLGTRRLAELIGSHRAFDLVLNSRRIDAQVAADFGLITEVLEKEEIDRKIAGLGDEVSQVRKESFAVLREATRSAQGIGTADLERVARSIMHVRGVQ